MGNGMAESFFSSLKKEKIKNHIYKPAELAVADIAEYFDSFSDRDRRHNYLGGSSPEEFEAAARHQTRVFH